MNKLIVLLMGAVTVRLPFTLPTYTRLAITVARIRPAHRRLIIVDGRLAMQCERARVNQVREHVRANVWGVSCVIGAAPPMRARPLYVTSQLLP